LLIPVAKAHSFKQNLAMLPFEDRVDLKRYHAETAATMEAKIRHDEVPTFQNQHKVKVGESLLSIADKYNTTPQSIRQANHLTSNTIQSGMQLKMPTPLQKGISSQPVAKMVNNIPGNTQIYVVKKGDTFWNISQKFAVSEKDIASVNKITSKTALVLGQKLTIKAANQQVAVPRIIASAGNQQSKAINQKAATLSAVNHSINYTVKQGDSLAQISRKFNVSIADLRKWNPPAISNALTPGKKLKVILNT
jgi:membrane-bound lytic murein transglycosylase D